MLATDRATSSASVSPARPPLPAHGANVVVVDRDQRAAQRGVDAIVAAGGRSLPVVADMLDEAQVMAAVDTALEAFGRLDVVQNNVGRSAWAARRS